MLLRMINRYSDHAPMRNRRLDFSKPFRIQVWGPPTAGPFPSLHWEHLPFIKFLDPLLRG